MQDPSSVKPEKPKIQGPKPAIASKPKFVPPVNLKTQKVAQDDSFQASRHTDKSSVYVRGYKNDHLQNFAQNQQQPTYTRKVFNENSSQGHEPPYSDLAKKNNETCDKFNYNSKETNQKICSGQNPKAPNSPSTVCCSILTNVGNDCCGIIVNHHKKELESKMTKIDSVDSNSSDSGGFKEFVQRDMMAQHDFKIHQRKASQPEFSENLHEARNQMSKSFVHQRQSSQPEESKLSFAQNKQNFIASAQALEHFLPQSHYICSKIGDRTDGDGYKPKMSGYEEFRGAQSKPRQPLIPPSQFQNTTKKLEEFLAQRVEREKTGRKSCLVDGESSQDVEQKVSIQKQIQQKLQADLQRTVKQIQEIQSIELRLPQNRKWTESNRSQPAIGLKHTPKSRIKVLQGYPEMDDPEIQETVEQILGKGVKVIDCEKKSSIKEEEVLLINGIPVKLEGRDGRAIKEALITGQVPPCDLLNSLLIKTGILKAPVKLDTSLSVKSTTVTKEEVTVSRDGKIVDERSRETKEHNFYTSAISEVYEPIKVIPTSEFVNGRYTTEKVNSNGSFAPNGKFPENGRCSQNGKFSDHNGYETGSDNKFSSFSSASSYESDGPVHGYNSKKATLSKDSGHLSNSTSSTTKVDCTQSSIDSLSSLDETDFQSNLCDKLKKSGLISNGYLNDIAPTIFGTVASDHTPKDCSNRRSLPQTPPSSKNYSSPYNGDAVFENASVNEIQHENALVYKDGNLTSGSLEALIQHMVPTDLYYPDRAYLFAFLLSSRLFIKPHDLLARVRSLCESQQGLGNAAAGSIQPGLFRFAEHLVQLLAEWTETFPYDFRDDRVMQHIRTITQQCCSLSSSLRANVSSLLHNLLQRLTALEAYEKALDEPSLISDENVDISDVCTKPEVLAQQLTHVELERLSYIGPEEFVQAFAKENPHIETSFKDMKKTHNLEQYVQWFNRLSYFVATQVIKHLKKKPRVRVVEYWVEVGRECFNIGNFNSLMAIIAGLNMSPVSRLKKTWHKIQSGKFAILEHQMDPSSNFSSYRSTLKAAMWRSAGATDQRQRIVIPFFSLLVKDLYFLNQGCSSKLPNGHINFEKFWQLAKQVTEFMAWKQVTCPFEKDPKIIAVLQYGLVLSENALALASFDCEPPENPQEKERCKSLKAEESTTT